MALCLTCADGLEHVEPLHAKLHVMLDLEGVGPGFTATENTRQEPRSRTRVCIKPMSRNQV